MRQHAQRAAATFEKLQKKLKAAVASVEELAGLANITAKEVEMILDRTYREHSIDLVAAGREKVGPDPIFVARRRLCPKCGRRHGATIALYSALPEKEWRERPPAEQKVAELKAELEKLPADRQKQLKRELDREGGE